MLTKEQILDAAEDVLRRFGPRKTTVVDVARALDVSHGTVYRHFASKAELHEAITSRWLKRVNLPLTEIVKSKDNSKKRLRQWFETIMDIKQQRLVDDPEMFASYSILAKQTPEHKVIGHINELIAQVEQILIDGCKEGSFEIEDCAATAQCLFDATLLYHHPLHAEEWKKKAIKQNFHKLFDLLERAISAR